MPKPTYKFPKHFFWGVATSAHQVEGNNHNQWSVWELENAKVLAAAAPHRVGHLDNWDEIKAMATDPSNYVSGDAVDHYRLYEKDFDIAKAMGLNAFRFSIEWSRIEPKEGHWDAAEIQHYRDYIKALKARGLEPFVTLFHWTTPVWFAQKGGFEKARNIRYFVRFAEKILQEFGPELRYITTINEPDTVVMAGYVTQNHPPQKNAPVLGAWVYLNLLRSHRQIYKLARQKSRRFKVGFTKAYAMVSPTNDTWQERLMTRLDYLIRDDLPLWVVGRKTAFIGMNYYFSDRREGFKLIKHIGNVPVNDLGWEMLPDDLEKVLLRVGKRRPKVPIIVTETGVADENDKYRQWWLAHTLDAIHKAMGKGVRVEGYMHWSLLDNFEWAFGKWPRFGLISVDYKTMKRSPRDSARWYARVVKQMRKGE